MNDAETVTQLTAKVYNRCAGVLKGDYFSYFIGRLGLTEFTW